MKAYKRLISIFLVLICMFQQAGAARVQLQLQSEALKAEIQKEPKTERLERIVEKILAKLQRNTAEAKLTTAEKIFLAELRQRHLHLEKQIRSTEMELLRLRNQGRYLNEHIHLAKQRYLDERLEKLSPEQRWVFYLAEQKHLANEIFSPERLEKLSAEHLVRERSLERRLEKTTYAFISERQAEQKLLAEPERLVELQEIHKERHQKRRQEILEHQERHQERLELELEHLAEQKRLAEQQAELIQRHLTDHQTKPERLADEINLEKQRHLAELLADEINLAERETKVEQQELILLRLLPEHQKILLTIATAVAKYQKKIQAEIQAELQKLLVAEIRVNEIVEAQIYGRTRGIANFIEIILGTQGAQAIARPRINITDYTKTGAKIRELICLNAKIEALSAVLY